MAGRSDRRQLFVVIGGGVGRFGGGDGGFGLGEEDEGAVLGLVVVVLDVGGAEIDAGAALQRGEEGRGDARAQPARYALDLLARDYARVLHFDGAELIFYFFSFLEREINPREREKLLGFLFLSGGYEQVVVRKCAEGKF